MSKPCPSRRFCFFLREPGEHPSILSYDGRAPSSPRIEACNILRKRRRLVVGVASHSNNNTHTPFADRGQLHNCRTIVAIFEVSPRCLDLECNFLQCGAAQKSITRPLYDICLHGVRKRDFRLRVSQSRNKLRTYIRYIQRLTLMERWGPISASRAEKFH